MPSQFANEALRLAILSYFWKPRRTYQMADDPTFKGFDPKAVHKLVRALDDAGLIVKLYGERSGATYQTTQAGRDMLIRAKGEDGAEESEA